MNKLTRSALIALSLAALVWVISEGLSLRKKGPDVKKMAIGMQKGLEGDYKDFNKLVDDKLILYDLITNTFNSSRYGEMKDKPYIFLLYMNGDLLFWNRNQDIPPPSLATALPAGNIFLKLDNGYFEIFKYAYKVRNIDLIALGMVQVKSNYRIENRYLKNTFNPDFKLPDYVDMQLLPAPQNYPVKDPAGNVIFYLKADNYKAAGEPDYIMALLQLVLVVSLVMAINIYAFHLANNDRPWQGFFFLVVTIAGLRAISLLCEYPAEFYKLPLFHPEFFASSSVNRSLGDLVINIVLILNIVYVFFAIVPIRWYVMRTGYQRYLAVMGCYLALCAGSYGLSALYNSLILNSNIPFDLNNFMSLSGYSLIGLLCISMVLAGFLLVTYRTFLYIRDTQIAGKYDIVLLATALGIYLEVLFLAQCGTVYFFTAAWIFVYLIFVRRSVLSERPLLSFTNVMVIVILFALLSSVHVYHYNGEKNLEQRKLVARKLADQRDRVTEYLFSDVQQRIFSDPFIRNYFLTPFITTTDIEKRIRMLYFSGYFSKYNIEIYMVNKEGQPLQPVDADFYSLEDPNAELSPPSDYLYFIPKAGGNYLYFGNLPIHFQNKFIGTVILKLSPKTYSKTNLYPELLLEENIKPPDEEAIYSYAIYQDGQLIRKEGIYPYNSEFNLKSGNGEYALDRDNAFEHLVYNAGEGKKVVITSKLDTYLQPTTLFSYLFCFFLAFAFAALVINIVAKIVQSKATLADFFNITFREKIQYAMIVGLVSAFLIIGLITVASFSSQYSDYNVNRLVGQEISIREAIQYGLKGNSLYLKRQEPEEPGDSDVRSIDLASLADVHAIDVNIYDTYGNIINTSQPDIFGKGLQSSKMDPDSYKHLVIQHESQYIHNESIGSLTYLSIYVPLVTSEGQLMGYLNLPYFAKEKELRSELSSFLVTLVNVYVLLLVLGGFFAYLLSTSITAPLSVISAKLKLIQLGKKSEAIEWRGRDEIGILVTEYNKLIGELQHSADMLARSERESAWREMAKQVAHEIKNPLTPMKLSIQHLQRAMIEGRPGVNELVNKVLATLIEQIDNLNHIASEFSNFAKMPAVENEVFDLTEVVRSVVNLFNEEMKDRITFTAYPDPLWVYADQNQVLRGFNNLVKNATQAIPTGRKANIQVDMEVQKGFVTVSVKDNGTGISEEQREKVFVPNFTTKSSGTGLGLAITRQIIENAGGEIWFESTVGVGTTFFVKLPIYGR